MTLAATLGYVQQAGKAGTGMLDLSGAIWQRQMGCLDRLAR